MEGYVYILKFDRPLGNTNNNRGQARYYVGWAADVNARLIDHHAGRGAAITRACVERGIGFDVVLVLPGSRELERAIKRQKNTPRFISRFAERNTAKGGDHVRHA